MLPPRPPAFQLEIGGSGGQRPPRESYPRNNPHIKARKNKIVINMRKSFSLSARVLLRPHTLPSYHLASHDRHACRTAQLQLPGRWVQHMRNVSTHLLTTTATQVATKKPRRGTQHVAAGACACMLEVQTMADVCSPAPPTHTRTWTRCAIATTD